MQGRFHLHKYLVYKRYDGSLPWHICTFLFKARPSKAYCYPRLPSPHITHYRTLLNEMKTFAWGHYRVGNTRETRSTQSLLTAEVTWFKLSGIGCKPFMRKRKRKRRNSQMILKQAQLHFHYIKGSAVFPASSNWLRVNSHHKSVHCSQHPVWQRSFKSES